VALGSAEKAANRLGKLQFIWGIAVLLGGFASALNITDFRCITVNLISEGANIFIRSHELEWQHHAAQTSTARVACYAPAYQLPLFYTLAFMEASLFGVLDVEGLHQVSHECELGAYELVSLTAGPLLLRRCHRQLR
jgi:hypothetical protein